MQSVPHSSSANPAIPVPSHGRSGEGVASILPHLYRQQLINDKPLADEVRERPAPPALPGSGPR